MIFGHFLLNVNEVNAFILGCPETHEALLVDAGACDPRFAGFLEKHRLRLSTIFITHHHWDHTDGLAEVLKQFDAEVYSMTGEAGGCATRQIGHGGALRVGKLEARVVHTPGHTPDGLSLIFPGLAFTGDALFAGSVGGTGTPADAGRQLDAIREHIFCLPDDCELHVGHGPSTTVRVEREFNPFFR